MQDRTGVLAPIRLIKINGEKIASVVDQQWIHAGSDLAPEMLANDAVGNGRIKAMTALATFYGRQFANARSPFVGARGAHTQAFPSSCLSSELDRYPPSRERVVGRV